MLIRGGRVVDPSQGMDAVLDVLLADGRVARVGEGIDAPEGAETVDATGLHVAPGLIDVHVHLREPGQEHKETIRSGARAAAAGGFTAVVAMPNTDPPIDSPAAVGFVRAAGMRADGARVYPSGCITMGQAGEQLTEFGELIGAGAVCVTDDGRPVSSAGMMRMALEYAQTFDLPVAVHAEELTLSRGGSMNEGIIATRLGLTGIPNASEDVMIARDLMLAELTGGRLHIQHVATRGGVELIRAAKERGVRVTAEGSPHHFTLTDEMLRTFDAVYKVNPPLRTAADIAAIKAGLADGTIDAIATDHAPHPPEAKEAPLDQAPPGMLGLETALALALTELDMPLVDIVAALSWKPAAIAGLTDRHGCAVEPGSPANLTVFDAAQEWNVVPAKLASLSRNTPYSGRVLRGKVRHTIFEGAAVVVDGVAQR